MREYITVRLPPIPLMVAVAMLVASPATALVAEGERAPEIVGHAWINSPPLTMEGLTGRVVLVEFWTYG
jgi:hypothetical protein